MSAHPVMILAGGTGGHIFPGLAVAHVLKAQGVPVIWMGSVQGLENTLVTRAGIALERISVSGLRGKGIRSLMAAPWRLTRALFEALTIVRRHSPRVALAFGGFAAGPGGIAARLSGVPLIVHEQNRIPGYTNRLLSLVARRVLSGFPGTFKNAEAVGNPVREEIAALPVPSQRLPARSGALRVLVLGGSQGARALNRALPAALAQMDPGTVEVWHQAGRSLIDEARAAYAEHAVGGRVVSFIDDMQAAYAWADVVVCRAGALTLAELCAVGLASVLVPFPHAVDDHQTRNAQFLVERGAALLKAESPKLAASIANALRDFLVDRQIVLRMAEAARRLAAPEAAQRIAAICLQEARQ